MPLNLLCLGEWGESLREIKDAIAMFDENAEYDWGRQCTSTGFRCIRTQWTLSRDAILIWRILSRRKSHFATASPKNAKVETSKRM